MGKKTLKVVESLLYGVESFWYSLFMGFWRAVFILVSTSFIRVTVWECKSDISNRSGHNLGWFGAKTLTLYIDEKMSTSAEAVLFPVLWWLILHMLL